MSELSNTEILLAQILNVQSALLERLTSLELRLDKIQGGQAPFADLPAGIEASLAQIISFRDEAKRRGDQAFKDASTIARTVAQAHAAACGKPAALAADVLDDPLLERFLARHPDGIPTVNDNAIDRYRREIGQAKDHELPLLLAQQYAGSPLDSGHTKVLRFQLAAVTRSEFGRRGIPVPPAPTAIGRPDGDEEERKAEFERLARTFSTRPLHEVYADPLLASTVDEYDQNKGSREPVLAYDKLLTQRLREGRLPEPKGDLVAVDMVQGAEAMVAALSQPRPIDKAAAQTIEAQSASPTANERLAAIFRSGDTAKIAAEPELTGAVQSLELAKAYFAATADRTGEISDIPRATLDMINLLADEIARGGRPELKPEFKEQYLTRSRGVAPSERTTADRWPGPDHER